MKRIKYLVLDVDGVFTDGSIFYDESGNEIKKFSTKDAAGVKAALAIGIDVIILTGRKCNATHKRMSELGISNIFQGVLHKEDFLNSFKEKLGATFDEFAYVADDLNDYNSLSLCGFKACPSDACEEIKSLCDYVSCKKGGDGVVRDVVEHILKERNQWKEAIKLSYELGV